jgi:hypothetical protein
MSCALPENTPHAFRAICGSQAALHADLANGLHAMAQPLTIVRGALGAMTLCESLVPEHGRYLEMSAQQVERLCDLMSCLQGLLEAAQFDADCAVLGIWDLIDPVLEDLEPLFDRCGVRISTAKGDHHLRAIGDSGRAETALRTALQTIASLSSRGDLIEFDVLPRDGFVEMIVQNRNLDGDTLGSADRLRLSLVKANIHSQQGIYECLESPFRISLKLPLQDAMELCTEVMLHSSPVQQSN